MAVVVVGVAVALGSGCASRRTQQSNRRDAEMTYEVKQRLQAEDTTRDEPVSVRVDSRVVILAGEVDDEEVREEAKRIAESVAGVEGVVDHIEVRDEP